MRNLLVFGVFAIALFLSGCTEQGVRCADGTIVADSRLCPSPAISPTPAATATATATPPDDIPPLPTEQAECAKDSDCHVGGCSGTVCSSDANAITTCEWKEEYACYKQISCGCNLGQCGWEKTPLFEQCMQNARMVPTDTGDDELPPLPQ
ncbi:MAG: hypothetical protein V1835_04470 [Candidatus Micrarchaeota archaeon]